MAHLFFSIVVVSLNPGEKLVPTLKSVLDQDYGNFEIIIKDGGSTDGSVEKLEELPADSRIRFFREPDKGIYDGMNPGAFPAFFKLRRPALQQKRAVGNSRIYRKNGERKPVPHEAVYFLRGSV